MPERCLLTGAGGFVGSHALRHLLAETDWQIVAVDSFRNHGLTDRIVMQAGGFPDWRARVHVVTHDLRVPVSPGLAAAIGPVDYVLDFASGSSVDESIAAPREFVENNIAVMLTVLEWARQARPRKIIHVSTDEVYGPAAAGYSHLETDPHRPSNPYSASKAAQEDLAFAWWRTFALPIAVSNTMNILGEAQSPGKFVPMVIRAVLRGETVPIHAQPPQVPGGGWKPGSRHYLHARNQASAMLHLLREVPFPRYGEGKLAKYNVAGLEEIDNLQLAQMIAGFIGKPLRYEMTDFHSQRPGHDLRYSLDATKITTTGWKPPVGLEDSLRKTVQWTVEHPEWLLDEQF